MNVDNKKFKLLLAAGAVSMALTGCGGSDGSDGEDGNPGGPAADAIQVLNLEVTKVTYDSGSPTVTVMATNEEDLPVVGLQDLGIVGAQLTPQGATGAGNSAQWTRNARVSGVENYTDNKNGTYTFILQPEPYNADLTQRFNVYAGGEGSTLADGKTSVPRREIVADFDGNGYEALYTKNIVSHQTCTNCHAEGKPLTTRHSSYYTQETCATCHSSSLSEESQWNHLIHNIHNSAKSFEDKYGKEYNGEAAEKLIQNNCQSCHVEPAEGDDSLTEWGNWSRVPTMETCTSCHTGIDFKAGQGHSQQNDNSNCVACHNASWTEEIHLGKFVQRKAFVDQYGMQATLSAVATDSGSDTTLSVTITDAAGTAIDAATLVESIEQLETITNVGPNFPIMGYNPSPGNGEHKVLINLVKDGTLGEDAQIVDGKLVTVIKDLPYGAGDTDTAFSFIGLSMCNDGVDAIACGEGVEHTSLKAELAHGTLSGEAPSTRHIDSVNFKACESCHGTEWDLHEKYHAGFVMTEQLGREVDGEMTVGIDGCVSCHTPDGTYASGGNLGAIEMKLHKTHSHGDYGAIVNLNCSQCHTQFNTDAFKAKGALATDAGYTTPIAATCYSCHSYSGDKFKQHVESQGAKVNASYEEANDAAQLETCFFCHNPAISDHTQVKM